jgi:Ras and EF-hand domain-containing protein
MRSEIALTPEQLEAVFDSLDVNRNGYLTIEQFLSGFGEYDAGINDSSANLIVKGKGTVHPRTGHEGPEGE